MKYKRNFGGTIVMNTKIIKIKLIEKNMTIKELSQKVDMNPQTISNWINGKNINQIENFIKICKILNIEMKDL